MSCMSHSGKAFGAKHCGLVRFGGKSAAREGGMLCESVERLLLCFGSLDRKKGANKADSLGKITKKCQKSCVYEIFFVLLHDNLVTSAYCAL